MDYEKQKMLDTSAHEQEFKQRKKKKKNPDTGFAGEFSAVISDPAVYVIMIKSLS